MFLLSTIKLKKILLPGYFASCFNLIDLDYLQSTCFVAASGFPASQLYIDVFKDQTQRNLHAEIRAAQKALVKMGCRIFGVP